MASPLPSSRPASSSASPFPQSLLSANASRSSSSLTGAAGGAGPSLSSLALNESKAGSGMVDLNVWEALTAEMIHVIQLSAQHSHDLYESRAKLVEREYHILPRAGEEGDADDDDNKGEGSEKKKVVKTPKEVDEQRDRVKTRLEGIGFKVGWSLAERLASLRPPFPRTAAPTSTTAAESNSVKLIHSPDPLELVKFVCKDLWMAAFDKQIDNLRTNHRGVYVLQDNAFRPFLRFSLPSRSIASDNLDSTKEELLSRAREVLPFTTGLIRGSLAILGLQCSVTADTTGLPHCTFQIKTKQN